MSNTIDILGDKQTAALIISHKITEFIDDKLKIIGNYAFYSCSSLTSISLPLVTGIYSFAFQNCSSLTSVSLPAVISISGSAFQGCSALTSVSLPAVTSIGSHAFQGCSALTSVSLPAVTSIDYYAFQGCSTLTSVILGNTETVVVGGSAAFPNSPNAIFYVPDTLVDSYKNHTSWSTYADRIKGISEMPQEG